MTHGTDMGGARRDSVGDRDAIVFSAIVCVMM
jgi:hypothetical protein